MRILLCEVTTPRSSLCGIILLEVDIHLELRISKFGITKSNHNIQHVKMSMCRQKLLILLTITATSIHCRDILCTLGIPGDGHQLHVHTEPINVDVVDWQRVPSDVPDSMYTTFTPSNSESRSGLLDFPSLA
jgi:hypothetical protein